MDKIIILITVIIFVLFYIGLSIVAINNLISHKRKRENLFQTINGLSQKALQRKIMLSGRWCTLQRIKDDPSLLDFLSHDDLYQFNETDYFFAERKSSLANNFIRKIFALPSEALQRKIEFPSGENFILEELKNKPWILKNLSKIDLERFLSETGLFRLRMNPR